MVGVPIRPVRQSDDARPRIAYHARSGAHVIGVAADGAIRPPEIHAPGCPKRCARVLGFGQALVNCPVAAHFACRQIAQPDTMTERRMLRDRAAEADLEIVGMRSEDEKIHVASVLFLQHNLDRRWYRGAHGK